MGGGVQVRKAREKYDQLTGSYDSHHAPHPMYSDHRLAFLVEAVYLLADSRRLLHLFESLHSTERIGVNMRLCDVGPHRDSHPTGTRPAQYNHGACATARGSKEA